MHKANYIALAINKGGTGKSHTGFNLGTFWGAGKAPFKRKKKPKVLVADLDPQSNLSNLFINSAREPSAIAEREPIELRIELEEKGFMMGYDLIAKTSDPDDLSILDCPIFCPNPEMMDLHVIIAKGDDATIYHQAKLDSPMAVAKRLAYRLDAIVQQYKFDVVLIDAPPGETQVEMLAALHMATDLVMPINWDGHSKEALQVMRRMIPEIQAAREEEFGDQLNVAGIVMNKLSPQSSQDRDFYSFISESFPEFSEYILKTGFQDLKPWKSQSMDGLPVWVPSRYMKAAQRKFITETMKSFIQELNRNLSDGVEFDDEEELGETA